jgi:hypothetical protein
VPPLRNSNRQNGNHVDLRRLPKHKNRRGRATVALFDFRADFLASSRGLIKVVRLRGQISHRPPPFISTITIGVVSNLSLSSDSSGEAKSSRWKYWWERADTPSSSSYLPGDDQRRRTMPSPTTAGIRKGTPSPMVGRTRNSMNMPCGHGYTRRRRWRGRRSRMPERRRRCRRHTPTTRKT